MAKDVMALQTAASLEVLAVHTYRTALSLPFIGGSTANDLVRTFATRTLQQHEEHLAGFNAAISDLGGTEQFKPDPKYLKVVNRAVPHLKRPADVIALALVLEDVAAATYVKDTGLVTSAQLRTLFLGIAGVEAQHKAVLLAVAALVKAGRRGQLKLPPDASRLPATLGSVGFPNAFYPITTASPVTEGAVR